MLVLAMMMAPLMAMATSLPHFTETDVSVGVTNSDVSLESGSLTGSSHLLDGHNLDDFVLEGLTEEVINDLELLDGDGEEEDLF